MTAVTVSPKFQVVIPKDVRQAMDLLPGAKLQVVQFEDRIEMIPLRSSKSLRGSLRGIDTAVPRDRDRV
ncbi:MAG: AbrB/MazE/SpoVT family DNA-binding domain-containing protein [Thermomonas sp.]